MNREEATSAEQVRRALRPTCDMGASRGDDYEPCDKPAATIVTYEWDGTYWTDPMCVWHAYRMGGQRNAIPLDRLVEALANGDTA